MKEITVKHYQCDHCGKHSEWAHEIQHHESKCLSEQEKIRKQHEEYQSKLAKVREDCLRDAKADPALQLLVKNGLTDAARDRVRDIYANGWHFDCGCSSWVESLFDEMLASVQGYSKGYNPISEDAGI